MMRKTFTRTVEVSTIKACKTVVEYDKPVIVHLDPITVTGRVSNIEAVKALKKAYGADGNYTVLSIESVKNIYEMDVEEFFKHARIKGTEA